MKNTLLYGHYLLLVVVVSVCSCNKEPKDVYYLYEMTNLSLENANNSGESPVYDSDSIPAQAYAITLNIEFETKGGYYGSVPVNEDIVNDFKITSNDTINGIPPNQPLNEFFYFSTGSGVGVPIEASGQFYTDMFSSRMTTNHNSFWGEKCYLLLMDPPDEPGLYTFNISVSLSDGRSFYPTKMVTLY